MEHTSVGRHVFITYGRAEPDAKFAYRLADDLRAAGHQIWMDVKGPVRASQWSPETQTAIDQCYAYLVILSPDSILSDWVYDGLLYALQNKRGYIFPILYRDVKIPPELMSIRYIDFRHDYDRALQSLLRRLPASIYTGQHFIRASQAPGRAAHSRDAATVHPRRADKRIRPRRLPVWSWAVGGTIAVGMMMVFLIGLTASGALGGSEATPTQPVAGATVPAAAEGSLTAGAAGEATSPAIAPSGMPEPTAAPTPLGSGKGQLLYVSNRDGDLQAEVSELYLTLPGSAGFEMVWSSAAASRPGWSPDGSQIVFTSWQDGSPELYILNLQSGGNIERLTYEPSANEIDPAWSPDGSRIAFASNYGGSYAIYVIDLATRAWKRVSDLEGQDWEPSWSPDGSQIVFTSQVENNYDLYVVDVDSGGEIAERRLTREISEERYPSWSPDGARIAFATTLNGGDFEIALINPDGTGLTLLTDHAAADTQPAWSPDSQWIAFTSGRDGHFQIYLMAADGSGQTRAAQSETSDMFPAWQP